MRHRAEGERVTASDRYENRLLERFRQGDAQAMTVLFERNVEGIYAYARHLLGTREDAEEAVSETFLKAFRRAEDFRGEGTFQAWLYTIARNLCRDRLRQPRLLILPIEAAETLAVLEGDPARNALHAEVREALTALPEEYQDVLLFCEVEEWSAREAAVLLGRSEAATKSLLYRARRALRALLTERWQE